MRPRVAHKPPSLFCDDEPVSADDQLARRVSNRTAWVVAAAFVLVLAAVADLPPPPGFLWVIVWAAILSVLIRRLLPSALALWETRGAVAALSRSALVGTAFGWAVWAVASVVSGGEPTIDAGTTERVVGFAAMGLLGGIGAAAVAGAGRACSSFESRRGRRR